MSRYAKTTLVLLLLAAVCWFTELVFNPAGFELILFVAAGLFTMLFVSFGVLTLARKLWKTVSPYRVFALVNGCIGLAVLIYAIYDIKTDTGWFAGLFGVMLLVFVLPFPAVLLVIDFAVWLFHKIQKRAHASAAVRESTETDNSPPAL